MNIAIINNICKNIKEKLYFKINSIYKSCKYKVALKRKYKMNTTNINEINKLKSIITYYCEEMIFHPFNEYQESGRRILNAARVFYYNILRLQQNTSREENLENILNQNMKMLKQIKDILEIADTVPAKEQKIKELLEKEQLKPEGYLYLDKWEKTTDFALL